jgi:hypothetical protein
MTVGLSGIVTTVENDSSNSGEGFPAGQFARDIIGSGSTDEPHRLLHNGTLRRDTENFV